LALAAIKVLGVEIRLDASWIILALLIAWSLAAGVFPELHAGLPVVSYWTMAAATVVGVAVSIVLHEMGHTLVARMYGVEVKSITLFMFGGVASVENEPRTARAELFMAIIGPIVSGVLAVLFFAAAAASAWPAEVHGVLHYLGMLNAALAVFNLAPAFPLDGGRVLRALLWLRSGDPVKATVTSARAGEVFAWIMMGTGVLAGLGGAIVGGLWWIILGYFILTMARAYRMQAEAKVLLVGLSVADAMTPDPITAPADASVEEFVRDCLSRHPHDLVPIVRQGVVIGGAGLKEAQLLPREQWPATRVAEIAVPAQDIPMAPPEAALAGVLERMQQKQASRLLVVDRDRLVGILTLKDVLAHMQFRQALAAK
jgi:Zn-dependent protease